MRNLVFIIAIGVLLATPFVYSNEIYNGLTTFKQIWFYGALSLLFIVFAINLLFDNLLFFKVNNTDILLFIFFLYLTVKSFFSNDTPILSNVRFVNYALLTLFYFIMRQVFHADKKRHVRKAIEVFILLFGLIEALWGLLQLYGLLPSLNANFKITGTFFNPAPYALYLAVIFPLSLWIFVFTTKSQINAKNILVIIRQPLYFFFANKNYVKTAQIADINKYGNVFIKYLSLITLIAVLLILPATTNRASWVAVIAGSAIIFCIKYDITYWITLFLNNRLKRICAIILTLAMLLMAGAGLYYFKRDSANGKLLIWKTTLCKIIEKPWTGYGLGSFEAEYNNWQSEYFQKHPDKMRGSDGMVAGNTKYAFNEFIEITAETGLIGLILFLLLIMSPFIALFQKGGMDKYCFKFWGMFIALLFCGFMSFPFYSLPTQIFLFLLLALLSTYTQKKLEIYRISKNEVPVSNIPKFIICAAIIAIGFFLVIKIKKMYPTYYTFDEADLLMRGKNYPEACQSLAEIYPAMKYNGTYYQFYGKVFFMQKKYVESLIMLRQAQKYTSDEVLYTTLGDCQKALAHFAEAEQAYLHASYMVPNKFYPLYLLVKLYNETGNILKAKQLAVEIIHKKVKVQSPAIDEIKEYMKQLLN